MIFGASRKPGMMVAKWADLGFEGNTNCKVIILLLRIILFRFGMTSAVHYHPETIQHVWLLSTLTSLLPIYC